MEQKTDVTPEERLEALFRIAVRCAEALQVVERKACQAMKHDRSGWASPSRDERRERLH